MKNKHFLNWIFSVKNEGTKKSFTILGLNFCYDMTKNFEHYKNLPVQNNKIVFCNAKGKRGYGCNPKYIAEEMLNRGGKSFDFVWLVDKNSREIDFSEFPPQVRLVDFKSKKALKELATAKVWIDNQAKGKHVKRGLFKKKGQIYIQTWHGSLGIKKIGDDSPTFSFDKNIFQKEAKMIDYLISNSKLETDIYKVRFWNNAEIMEFGHPRNDVFFKSNEQIAEIKNKICKLYNIDTDTKIILYAPTFRNNLENNDCYGIDYHNILNTFERKYNCKFVIFTRLHHEMTNLHIPKSRNIVDVTKYGDIQELMLVSDFMISDYSSCMFDFMLSRKPCFIFAKDLKEYEINPGFYYPLESTPFPIAVDNDTLNKNILNFDEKEYKDKVEEFLENKRCVENGHASEKVVDLLEKIINV